MPRLNLAIFCLDSQSKRLKQQQQQQQQQAASLGNYLLDYLLQGVAGATLAAYETGREGMR